ncbi:MAG TPA: A24 family peptidase [Acidimicrobiales bacterium]|nr:A24 family peptidase [Acidimicrobiales bacterium]
MTTALLAVGGALLGVLVVGPAISHATTRWLGWRVTLPLLLGRVPARSELGHARARCAACGADLAPAGLPLRPAALWGWRCPGCRTRLPRWTAAVEIVTGGLFALCAAVVGPEVVLPAVLAFAAGMVATSVVDLAVMRIPTRFVYVTAGATLAGLVIAGLVDGTGRRLAGAALGAAIYGGLLLVMHLISPRMLGFGDVRLATVVGMTVGWSGWRADHPVFTPVQAVLNACLLAALLGTVAGLVLIGLRGRDRPFPFGPAIAAGGLVMVLSLV